MEGYFPVAQYCDLTDVKKDTAHHRAERGTVPAFKDENGRWFIYFTDEQDPVPKGFIPIKEYAKLIGKKYDNVLQRIRAGFYSKDDYIKLRCMTKNGAPYVGIFIRNTTPYPTYNYIYEINKKVKHVLNVNRPDGYLTVREFSEREEMPRHIIYYFIKYKKLKSTFVKGYWYVLGTETMKGVKIRDYKMSSNKL